MAKLINADKLIKRLRSKKPIGDIGKITLDECIAEINYAEPVEPEKPKGKWMWKERNKGGIDYITGIDTETGEKRTIQVDNRHIEKRNYCSLCGMIGDDAFMNYCPNCGADMGVSE